MASSAGPPHAPVSRRAGRLRRPRSRRWSRRMVAVAVFMELALLPQAFSEAQEVVRLGAVRRRRDDLMASPTDGTILVDRLRFCSARTDYEISVARRIL